MKLKFVHKILLIVIIFPLAACGNKIKGDINCDGKNDLIEVKTASNEVTVLVTLHNKDEVQRLAFGKESIHNECLIGKNIDMTLEKQQDLVEELGGNPEGYQVSDSCFGLIISSKSCDPTHVYWNHKKNQLNWWR